jgi:hypothetical protein
MNIGAQHPQFHDLDDIKGDRSPCLKLIKPLNGAGHASITDTNFVRTLITDRNPDGFLQISTGC